MRRFGWCRALKLLVRGRKLSLHFAKLSDAPELRLAAYVKKVGRV